MSAELHLFVLWSRAAGERGRILEDISTRFEIIEINNIRWDEDNFSRNMTRFYGVKLPPGSFKEVECGTGRFTLVVVLDRQPVYEERATSKGSRTVNAAMFDAKERYRAWTGGGHKVHATNDTTETRHDIILLTGKTMEEYLQRAATISPPVMELQTDRNLTGCVQWESLGELLGVLNESVRYLVLRNFDGMPDRHRVDGHDDIDLLVDDPLEAAYILNLDPVFTKKYRVHYRTNISNVSVRFDLRSPGDGYYDRKWQERMLGNRVMHNGFYVPSDEDYRFSLLYHALVHKPSVAPDYDEKLAAQGFDRGARRDALLEFMRGNGYSFTEPVDRSVYYNRVVTGAGVSVGRRLYEVKRSLLNAVKSRLSTQPGNRASRRLVRRILGYFR